MEKVFWSFPGGTVVKNLSANAEDTGDQVQSLGWEDPLEKEMATHSCILVWRIPWTEEPGRLQSMGCKVHQGDTGRRSQGCKFCQLVLIICRVTQTAAVCVEGTGQRPGFTILALPLEAVWL